MTTMMDVPPGLAGVAVAETTVGDVRGEEGFYHYRQYDACELARHRDFEAVWRLMIDGALPRDAAEHDAFAAEVGALRALPPPVETLIGGLAPLDAPDAELRAAMAALGGARQFRPLVDLSPEQQRADALAITAAMPTAVAALHRRRQGLDPIAPDPRRPVVEDYLRQLSGADPDPVAVRALEQYLISTIDHGFNASTFTARVVASTGADMAASVVAAMGALSGPRHGGAPSRVLDLLDAIGTADRAGAWVRAELDAGRRIPGFGHAVYRTTDPRSQLLAEVAATIGGPRAAMAAEVETAAVAELARRYPDRRLVTNVEFWAAIVLEQANVPRPLFTSTFAVARVVGWTANILEQATDSKIIRPAARYIGPEPARVMPTDAVTLAAEVASGVWLDAGGAADALDRLVVTGPAHVLPSPFLVTPAATAAIGVAGLAVAELTGAPGAVVVDTVEAATAVRSERYAGIVGTKPVSLWDPVAGDYPSADGWIRLHTNYPHHRRAALTVLGVEAERDVVARAVGTWPSVELESAIVAAGGCAAALHSVDEWKEHEHGRQVRDRPLVAIERVNDGPREPLPGQGAAPRPLAGLRVLDLTRVIAGPVATRFLASWGADVLRVEAPQFDEFELLRLDVGFGKRSCGLDLRAATDRAVFESLMAGADVVVHGYRPGALAGLGYSSAALTALRPGLVVAALSAYGAAGPWRERRGFDSLVQMSSGIAAEGASAAGSDRPVPLPCQLLDHATGYLLAFGALRALHRRAVEGGSWTVEVSLARTAAWLDGLGRVAAGVDMAEPEPADVERWCEVSATPWGNVHHVGPPGAIGAVRPCWDRPPSRPGADAPAWI